MSTDTDEGALRAFIAFYHEAAATALKGMPPGILQLCTLSGGKMHTRAFEVGDTTAMVAAALEAGQAGANVFVETRSVRPGRPAERGTLTATVGVFAIVVDRDHDAGKGGRPLNGEPSVLIQTSGQNIQEWFFLSKALPAEEAAELGAAVRKATLADACTGVPTQPFRLPGLMNHPDAKKRARGRVPVQAKIISFSRRLWTGPELMVALPLIEPCILAGCGPKAKAPKAPRPKAQPPQPELELKAAEPKAPSKLLAKQCAMDPNGRDRSREFQRIVSAAIDEGLRLGELETLLRANPNGIAQKYLRPADRLHAELERSWDKAQARRREHQGISDGGDEEGSDGAEPEYRHGTAAELRALKAQPVEFLLPGILPAVGLCLLVAKPKAGKSWLVLDLALAVAAGVPMLGDIRPPTGSVLLLALEDSRQRLRGRIEKLLPMFTKTWPQALTWYLDFPRLNKGGLKMMRDWVEAERIKGATPKLIVVDVLACVRSIPSGRLSAYQTDYNAIAGLRKLAHELGVAVVCVHHTRKLASDDPQHLISGTQGLAGAADTNIVIDGRPGGTVWDVRGRDVESTTLAAEFNKQNCRWSILGEADKVHAGNTRATVLRALTPEPQSAQEIADNVVDMTGKPISLVHVRRILRGELKRGEIENPAHGKFAKPDVSPACSDDGQDDAGDDTD
jgi:hypothetical protein